MVCPEVEHFGCCYHFPIGSFLVHCDHDQLLVGRTLQISAARRPWRRQVLISFVVVFSRKHWIFCFVPKSRPRMDKSQGRVLALLLTFYPFQQKCDIVLRSDGVTALQVTQRTVIGLWRTASLISFDVLSSSTVYSQYGMTEIRFRLKSGMIPWLPFRILVHVIFRVPDFSITHWQGRKSTRGEVAAGRIFL